MKIQRKKIARKKRAAAGSRKPETAHGFWRVSTLLLALYVVLLFWLKLYDFPILPDEVKFLWSAKNMPSIFSAYASYDYSYGGAFWALLYLVRHALGTSACSAVFLLLLISPLLMVWRFIGERARIFALIFWLTMPMAWWHGKIISADTLNIFIIGMCILSAWRRKPFWTCFLAGLAVGIKLSAAAVMPAIFILLALRMRPVRWKDAKYLLAAPLGFIVGCPAWILHAQSNLITLHGVTAKSHAPLLSLSAALFNNFPTWDLVVSLAPLGFLLTNVGYAFLLAFAVWKKQIPLLCAILAFALLGSTFLVSAVTTNWYWFPFFTIFFIASFLEQEELRPVAVFLPIMAIIFCGQLCTYTMFNLRLTAIEAWRNWDSEELAACLAPVAKTFDRPVYIRSFSSVETHIAKLAGNAIVPGAYRFQDYEFDNVKSGEIKDVVLVDTIFFHVHLYPGIENLPLLCDGRFALLTPNGGNKELP